ncbi:MAG: hypothetical protein R8P61_04630 [Bacteroidia bacterium]|nr:hypothetical protein [Bacteroidia bacterium]
MRFHYLRENAQGLQEFFCYLKLSNDKIIDIPVWPGGPQLEQESLKVLTFDTALEFQASILRKVLDAEIEDLLFRDTADFFSNPAILKLSSGFYLSEQNYASEGQIAGLCLWSQQNLDHEKQKWKGIKSYLKDIRK